MQVTAKQLVLVKPQTLSRYNFTYSWMEQCISEFALWVEQEKEKLYALCLRQDDPKGYFYVQIFPFFARLCQESRERVLGKHRHWLNSREQAQLTLRLQAIIEGALDDLGVRLGVKE